MLIVHLHIFLVKCQFRSFAHFLNWVICVLFWICKISLYILIQVSCQIYVLLFSKSVACFCQFLDDFFVFFFFNLYLLFLAVLALHCCTRLSLSVVIRGSSPLRCEGFSLWWLFLLQSTGSRLTALVTVPHGLSCSSECGIFLDQGSNLCPLHWPADS